MANVFDLNQQLLQLVKDELRLDFCLISHAETYEGRSLHIKVTYPDGTVDKDGAMRRVRKVVEDELARMPRKINILLIVEDDDDAIFHDGGTDFFTAIAADPASL